MRSGRIAAFIAALWTALLAVAETGSLSSDQWRQDLQFFALELPKRHINAYHHTPRSQFEAAVSNLDKKLAGMDYDETAIGFMRLAAMIGDAHTNVNLPAGSGLTFPLRLREFDGGFRVVAVAPGMEKALGAHLLKIDETRVDDAYRSLSALDAQDEHPWLRRAMAATELISARLLHGVGIIPADTAARYTFAADDGAEFSLAVTRYRKLTERATSSPQWPSCGCFGKLVGKPGTWNRRLSNRCLTDRLRPTSASRIGNPVK